jgi:hypothetical protein
LAEQTELPENISEKESTMPSTATITAYSGPGKLNTATEITGVTGINFDIGAGMLFVSREAQPSPLQFELTGDNTITLTASGGNYTLTLT